jgi:hypothetical protein
MSDKVIDSLYRPVDSGAQREREDFWYVGLYCHSLKGFLLFSFWVKRPELFDGFFLLHPWYSEEIHGYDSYTVRLAFLGL